MQGLWTSARDPFTAGHKPVSCSKNSSETPGDDFFCFTGRSITWQYAYTHICVITAQKNPLTPTSVNGSAPPFTPAQLLAFFLQLLPWQEFCQLPSLQSKNYYQRLFTPLVTIWYLLFQQLHHDHTLQAVVTNALAGGADALHKGLSVGLRSTSTVSYSDARQRLPWRCLSEALRLQGRKLSQLSPTTLWKGMRVALLDGSTVRLRPYGNIARHFPPHRNQHQTYWCLMRVLVCFCAFSGAALDSAMSSLRVSEQLMACHVILRSAAGCLFMGDRNFGIFGVVRAARQAGSHVLVRLTNSRAKKLLGGALELGDYARCWSPTRHDQVPRGCDRQPMAGRLVIARIQREGFRPQLLCLFTTLTDAAVFSSEELVQLYGVRWHVELNLRYLKAQMALAQLECKSVQMAKKEWLAGLMAYNLIRAAMLCAGLEREVPPLKLSFSSSRRHLEQWLNLFGQDQSNLLARWHQLLTLIARGQLPRRRRVRPSQPRKQRHLRQPYPPLVGCRERARQKMLADQLKS
jgi:IS4 transposase